MCITFAKWLWYVVNVDVVEMYKTTLQVETLKGKKECNQSFNQMPELVVISTIANEHSKREL